MTNRAPQLDLVPPNDPRRPPQPDEVDSEEAAKIVGVHRTTLNLWASSGRFPKPHRTYCPKGYGQGARLWKKSVVEAFDRTTIPYKRVPNGVVLDRPGRAMSSAIDRLAGQLNTPPQRPDEVTKAEAGKMLGVASWMIASWARRGWLPKAHRAIPNGKTTGRNAKLWMRADIEKFDRSKFTPYVATPKDPLPSVTPAGDFWDSLQVGLYAGVHYSTVTQWALRGKIPKPDSRGVGSKGRIVCLWRRATIEANKWIVGLMGKRHYSDENPFVAADELDSSAVCRFLNITPSRLSLWGKQGRFPPSTGTVRRPNWGGRGRRTWKRSVVEAFDRSSIPTNRQSKSMQARQEEVPMTIKEQIIDGLGRLGITYVAPSGAGPQGRMPTWKVICTRCNASHGWTTSQLHTIVISKHFTHAGWLVTSTGKTTCPTCLTSNRQQQQPIILETQEAPISQPLQNQPSPANGVSRPKETDEVISIIAFQAIRPILDDVYDGDAKRYRSGYSDQAVATKTSYSVATVIKAREMLHGKEEDPVIAGLKADFQTMRTMLLEMESRVRLAEQSRR